MECPFPRGRKDPCSSSQDQELEEEEERATQTLQRKGCGQDQGKVQGQGQSLRQKTSMVLQRAKCRRNEKAKELERQNVVLLFPEDWR
jgi:hypothetical protein